VSSFPDISWREHSISISMMVMVMTALYQTNTLSWIFKVIAYWNRTLRNMLLHFDIIKVITKLPNSEQSYKGKVKTHNYINRQNQSTILALSQPVFSLTPCMVSGEKTNTNFIVFGLIQPGFEPMSYDTWSRR
jgi:hypothetical protein